MLEIYRKSWACFRQAFWACLAIAVFIEVLPQLATGKHAGAAFVLLIYFAYYLHRHFLFSENLGIMSSKRVTGAPAFGISRFLMVSLALILAPAAIAFAIYSQLPPQLQAKQTLDVMLLLLMLPPYLVSLGLWGTALPAAVERNPAYRMTAGFRLAPGVMGQLLAGPVLFGVAAFSFAVGIHMALSRLSVAASPSMAQGIEFGFGVILRLIGLFNTTLAVAVLCQAYRKIVPAPVQADPTPDLAEPAAQA